ncbi:hypothetical protein IV102_21420 [bacterium]|nr:hypothetical protein [bacterium]
MIRTTEFAQLPDLPSKNQSGIILVVAKPDPTATSKGPIARTIRFPPSLRDRLTSDAQRCGRSFEGQVIALLRRHYGEDVDIAPSPDEILQMAKASLSGVSEAEISSLTARLIEVSEQS